MKELCYMKKFIAMLAALAVMCQFSLVYAEDGGESGSEAPAVKTETTVSADKSGEKSEEKTETKTEDKSEDKAEDKAEVKADDKTEAKEEDKTDAAENKADSAEEKTDADSEKETENKSETDKTDGGAAADKANESAADTKKESDKTAKDDKQDKKIDKSDTSSSEIDELVKSLIAQGKKELEAKKQEIKEYAKELKTLFKQAGKEARKKILEKLAEIKKDAGDITIGTFVDGVDVDYEKYDSVLPQIKNGTTLVPVRAVTEAFDAAVTWNGEDRTVTVKSGDNEIVLKIESAKAIVNGEEKELTAAPEIVEGRTIVPVRFIAQALGMDVEWDDASRTIIIE